MAPAVRRWKRWAAAAALGAVGLGITASAPRPSAAQGADPPPSSTTTAPTPASTSTSTVPDGPGAPSTSTSTPASSAPPGTTATTAPGGPGDDASATGDEPATPPDDDGAPGAPAPPDAADATGPGVAIEPAADLVDGTATTVTATGLTAGGWYVAVQCPTGAVDVWQDCDDSYSPYRQADAAGTAVFTLRVDALLLTYGEAAPETVDCRAPDACVVAVRQDVDGAVVAEAPLPFDPDGDLAPPPTVTVTPAGPLTHNQIVTVEADGLVWADEAEVMSCAAGFADWMHCDQETAEYLHLDGASAASTSVAVSAVIDTGDGASVDCRQAGACELVVGQRGPGEQVRHAAVPLVFDPDTEVVRPSLTVEPSTDLVDGQQVTVTGSGYTPGWLSLHLCGPGATSSDCTWTDVHPDVDTAGSFTATVAVAAIIPTMTGEVDCRTSTEPCLLVATRGEPSSSRAGRAELHFDPVGPVAPGPTITVEPAVDLPDEVTVTVTGADFDPDGYEAQVRVCRVGDTEACDAQTDSFAAVDNDGGFTTEVGLAATFEDWSGATVDCRVEPGCEVVARDGYRGRRATAPLAFAPPTGRGERYLAPVFDEVDVTTGVTYRHTTDASGAGVDLALDVYEPAGDTAEQRPVVVWLDGGWFSGGARRDMATYADAFARRGYVSVTMSYRARPGLQCCPTDDVEGVTAAIGDATDDAAAGLRWLRDHADEYRIDPDAIAVGGHQGGAAAAFGLAHDLPGQAGRTAGSPVAAALPIAGVDLGRPDAGEPPFLAFHATGDTTAPQHLSASACTRARAAATTCGTVGYGVSWGEGLADQRQRDIVRRSSDFLAETVLDRLGYVEWDGPDTPGGGPGTPAGSGGGLSTVVAAVGSVGSLPRTGGELARLAAVALSLGLIGAACLAVRRRRLTARAAEAEGLEVRRRPLASRWGQAAGLAADGGGTRVVAAAALAAVALVVVGFVVTGGSSPTSSTDGQEGAAGAHEGDTGGGHGDHHDHDTGDVETGLHTDLHDDGGGTDHAAHGSGSAGHDGAGHDAGAGDHDGHGPGDAADGGSGDGHAHPAPAVGAGHTHPTGDDDHHGTGGGTGGGTSTPTHPGHEPPPAGPGPTTPTHPGHEHPPTTPTTPTGPPDDGFDPSWTPEQVAYAQGLIDDTEAQLTRYANPGVLPLVGYQWIFDGQRPDEYQHWIHLSRISDPRTLDPAVPESLVFRNAADGPVLEASMYMLQPGYTMANIPADIAWLPGWHIHDNLCFVGNYELVGVTVNGRCERGSVIPTPPMVHVWVVETRCGRFAGVDEHGLQCHHEH